MIGPLLRAWDGERLAVHFDRQSRAWVLIAIHSTVLGPAAGGTRMKPYPDLDTALEDALRLSEGMTLKFAAPGLPFGGAKAVIMVPPDLDPDERHALLRRYGAMIRDLGGVFLTGPDVGTSPEDMDVIGETAEGFVFCRTPEAGGGGDPGPYTALGLFAGIETVCERLFGEPSVAGRRVLVQGAGDVGGPVILRLLEGGATVSFSEIDEALVRHFRDEIGVPFVAADRAVATECDVFAPCALGGILNATTIPDLRCAAVAGSANNQLGEEADGDRLRHHDILYAPDFVINVGGAMAMPGIETLGWTPDRAQAEVASYVPATLRRVFDAAAAEGISTHEAARRIATERLARG